MENNNSGFQWVGILVAIALATFGLFSHGSIRAGNTTASFWDAQQGYKVNGTTIISSARALSNMTSATFSSLVTLSGLLKTGVNATSTIAASAQTLVPADVNGYDTLILTPNVASITLTLFASSTASTFLPTAGLSQTTCIINGTTTAAVNITLAGGTGTTLLVASSSASTLGSLVIGPQKKGCITFTRGNATATTFDIISAFTTFK